MKNTILIVDDEAAQRDTLESLLQGQGYSLVFACNGQEGLEKAVEIKPDLILMDVMMPDMNGFEVCSQVRNNPLLSEVPVIMLTGLSTRNDRLQGIEAGADDFISKPYDKVELRSRVKTIIRLNRYRSLLQERAKFEWVVEQSGDGYIILSDKDEIFYANPRARLYLGLGDDVKKDVTETFLGIARKQYRFEPEESWASWPLIGEVVSPRYLVRPENEDSDVFWLQVELMNMSSTTGERYLVCLRNVTEKIIFRTNTWTFHSQVAHKLRSPMFALAGILEFLEMDFAAFSMEDLKSFIADAYKGALRIKEQIYHILETIESRDVVKPSGGKSSIGDIFRIIDEIKDELGLKCTDIVCNGIENYENVWVAFSIPAMKLVVRELFVNAKKFHPSNSPDTGVNISRTSDGIGLQISDDGLTLSPEQLRKMWTPYYQGEKYFTGEVPGMGLGLSTVAFMIWTAGGTCKSYNRKNGPGIVVELTFPLKKN